MLDIAGVDQPRIQPTALQHVKHRLPVVRGGLHDDAGHAQLAEPVGQPEQPWGQRRAVDDLLLATARPARIRDPDADDELALPDIDRRDPLDDLFVVLDTLHAQLPQLRPEPAGPRPTGAARESWA